jgi:hypothetical protein
VTAHAFFDQHVYPPLAQDCAGCHAAAPSSIGFIAADADTTYDALELSTYVGDYSAQAPLATLRTTHPKMPLDPHLQEVIASWFALERAEPGL